MTKRRHLTRQELIKAIRSGQDQSDQHLQECAECRELRDLLTLFPVAGRLPLPAPLSAWVDKAAAIAVPSKFARQVKRLVGSLVFDSWSLPQPVGVRSGGKLADRRLQFAAQGLLLDLRAEHHRTEWSFVAQVTGHKEETLQLQADRKLLQADADGFFEWSDRKPPRRLVLKLDGMTVGFPELMWRKPQST